MPTRRDVVRGVAVALTSSLLESRPSGAGEARRAQASPPGAAGALPTLVSLGDFETEARGRMTENARAYITGAAGDELTLRWNREGYDHIRLNPRVLNDVSRIDTSVTVFGVKLSHPILVAPTAYHRLVHAEGEIATARGAGAAAAMMGISSFATTSIEDIAKAGPGPLFFQLYIQPDRGLTREMVDRAHDAGCKAICVTVDTPTIGARNREARAGFALPEGLDRPNLRPRVARSPAATTSHRPPEGSIYSAILDATLTWKDIAWIKSISKVPVWVKGVLNPEDAMRAAAEGVDGVMVSNHGARNLDTVPATIDALPRIAAKVAGRVPLIVDGGVRRGTDIIKAIALGAQAVMIGRPILFGLTVDGADGVRKVIDILRLELEMAMALSGRRSLAELDPSLIWI